MTLTKTRDFELEIKAADERGIFSGYASVFGVVDSYGESVQPGAFAASLAALAAKGRKLPILWQHNTREPLGVYEVVKEDARGLYVQGQLLRDVARAREAAALITAGAITGLSIGYVEQEARPGEQGVKLLTRLDLKEISLVTHPANDEARVLRAEDVHSKAEFIAQLRELGWPKAAAVRLAAGGWSALHSDTSEAHPLAARVLAAAEQLRKFS